MSTKVPMRFDPEREQWYVELSGRNYGLHCGECMELYIGDEPVACRLELGLEWYVILKDVCFNLRSSDKYMISV